MLATACDIRIMVEGKAKIGLNEIAFGSSIFAGSLAMLAFWVGERRAQDILYAGKLYSAQEAHELGLIDAVVPDGQLLQTARQIAQQHAGKAPAAFRSIKSLLRKPVLEAMIAREGKSIEEFVEIWYSQETWKKLKDINIKRVTCTRALAARALARGVLPVEPPVRSDRAADFGGTSGSTPEMLVRVVDARCPRSIAGVPGFA